MPTVSRISDLYRRRLAKALAAAIVFGIVPFTAGCGGSGSPDNPSPSGPVSSASRGRAAFTIVWPEPTRLIPSGANSIVISLSGNGATGALLATQTISRPPGGQGTSVVAFESMEPGSIIATASAFPTTDGTGVAQASGQVPITIVADETAETSLTMNSTIDRLEVSPAVFRFYAAKQRGLPATGTVVVTPRNAAGQVVLVPQPNLQWTSSSPATTSISGAAPRYNFSVSNPLGVVTLTLRETESGKMTTVPIDIHGALYTVTDLGQEITDASQSFAYAINNNGTVVGYSNLIVNNRPRPAVWRNKTIQNVGLPPGMDFAYARDVNDDDTVVGYGGAVIADGNIFGFTKTGFVWTPSPGAGQFTIVPPPPGTSGSALFSINNQGKAAGGNVGDGGGPPFIYEIATNTSTGLPLSASPFNPYNANAINDLGTLVGKSVAGDQCYVFRNGIVSRIPVLLDANAVNSAGVIAGFQISNTLITAAISQNNQTTVLLPAETTTSRAYGMNNKGAVVGAGWGDTNAFIWGPGIDGDPSKSSAEFLNNLIDPASGWFLYIARDINDRGEIVGWGAHNGKKTAFLLTPIP